MKQLCNLLILKAWEIMCNKKIHPSIRKRERIKENKREATTNNKEKKALHCTHCEADGHDEENCWRLHPELRLKKFGGKGKKTWVLTQVMRQRLQPLEFKVKSLSILVQDLRMFLKIRIK